MAVAGCPDYFLHHPNYQQDNIDRSSNHRQTDLIPAGFQQSTNQSSPNHQVCQTWVTSCNLYLGFFHCKYLSCSKGALRGHRVPI
ncbi:hypothetical protein XENOCAPTIV_000102 [Xenoophorus captivus]|uniref:Uncharacterized protein n=1 Tax=Xenoophorus captivus TaxID=1517983 RepID=A0ABV0RMV4_9TELE